MLIEFDNWESSSEGSSFCINLDFVPEIGCKLLIHKGNMPSHYFEGEFIEQPVEMDDNLVKVTVSYVEHIIMENGEHVVQVDIDV